MANPFVEPFAVVAFLVVGLRAIFSDAALATTSRNYTGRDVERPDKHVRRRGGMGVGYLFLGGFYVAAETTRLRSSPAWPVLVAPTLGLLAVALMLWRERD